MANCGTRCKQIATVFAFPHPTTTTQIIMSTAVYSPTGEVFQQRYEDEQDMEDSYIETSGSQEVSDEGWRAIA